MHSSDARRAIAAATSTASGLGLKVEDAVVLHDSNRLALRLLPSDVFARVAPASHEGGENLEVELATRLAETDAPVAALEPRVAPRVYRRDGFLITFWTYYEPVAPGIVAPDDYADALGELHRALRNLDLATPHFTSRVDEALQLVASPEETPGLLDEDRQLLSDSLRGLLRAILDRGATEQLLHGEPHPGNVLNTKNGPLFIDLETGCRGPVAFDLAHVPEDVSARHPGVDQELLRECRGLVLAMVAAWRCDRSDQLPNGQRAARQLLDALRKGPPYPTLDAFAPRDLPRSG